MSLQDALQIVRDELVADEPPAAAIELAAKETGLRPELIARKAEENFGELATFGDRERVRLWNAEVRMAEIERAKQAAAATSSPARARPPVDPDVEFNRSLRRLLRRFLRAQGK